MKKQLYEKAVSIRCEIDDLQRQLDGCKQISPSSGLKISVKTGYSDMGKDIERHLSLRGDIALDVWCAARKVIEQRIQELEKEFEKL